MNFDDFFQQLLHPEDETKFFTPEDIQANKASAIMAGIPVLFWVPLVLAKDSPYGKFCANQGLLLLVMEIALKLAEMIAAPFLGLIPVLGSMVMILFSLVRRVFIKGCSLLLLINACQGKARRIPFIGGLFDIFK